MLHLKQEKMGYDTTVFLLRGFKFVLADVFARGWLDSSIMEEDDWQYLNMGDDMIEIVNKYVLNEEIKTMLLKDGWSLYILSSTQEDCNPDNSYLFIYSNKQDLEIEGEYGTGEVESLTDSGCKLDFQQVLKLGLNPDDYKQHWVIETSW